MNKEQKNELLVELEDDLITFTDSFGGKIDNLLRYYEESDKKKQKKILKKLIKLQDALYELDRRGKKLFE